MNTIVIGGGASGLIAAIFAAKNGSNVTIIEKENKTGKKLRITGNGKCNITNRDMSVGYFFGDQKFITQILSLFDVDETLAFFREIGIYTQTKNGYVYPMSRQAQTVANMLREYAIYLGVKIKNNNRIEKIEQLNHKFFVHIGIVLECDNLILATGGKSAPNTGSDGSGYMLAKQFGHTIIPPKPALTALICRKNPLMKAAGVRLEAKVTLIDQTPYSQQGEVQITDYGISGIPVLNLSRFTGPETKLFIDFVPDISSEDLIHKINHLKGCRKKISTLDILCGLMNDKLASSVLEQICIEKNKPAATLTEQEIQSIAQVLKNYPLVVKNRRGFDYAQVTQGGVCTDEINPHTMESKRIKHLYFAGEIMDVDAICGGYNLQFAWSTGAIAGRNCAR